MPHKARTSRRQHQVRYGAQPLAIVTVGAGASAAGVKPMEANA